MWDNKIIQNKTKPKLTHQSCTKQINKRKGTKKKAQVSEAHSFVHSGIPWKLWMPYCIYKGPCKHFASFVPFASDNEFV